MHSLAIAVWVGIPIIAAGLVHVAVIKLGLFRALATRQLDGGFTIRGRTLFGENKTLRGAITMIGASMGCVYIHVRASAHFAWAYDLLPDYERLHPLIWGGLAGAGYIAGELPNSFLKRQLGIGPGETGEGPLRPVFWTVDQIDSMVGVVVFLLPVWSPTISVVLALLTVTLIAHPAVALVMVSLGLKKRVG